MTPARISVLTPSFNMLGDLIKYHASIVDQGVPGIEHIVIDGGSTDGTEAWLRGRADIISIVGRDRGMYDALNKGLNAATGDLLAYLNCDEQYLPGALACAGGVFANHPDVDLLFGDVLLVNRDGALIAFRKGYTPRARYIRASHLYLLSCAMFFRRRLLEAGIRFDPELKARGDEAFVLSALDRGFRAIHQRRYVATFTWTGQNLSASARARLESRDAHRAQPLVQQLLRAPTNAVRLAEKTISGAYWQTFPLRYSIYNNNNDSMRTEHVALRGTHRWPM